MAGLAAPDVLLVPGRTGTASMGAARRLSSLLRAALYRWAVDRHRREPARSLLIRKHLKTGELAFMYCHVPNTGPPPWPSWSP